MTRRIASVGLCAALCSGSCTDERAGRGGDGGGAGIGELSTILAVGIKPGQTGVELKPGTGSWSAQRVGGAVPAGSALRTARGVRTRIALAGGSVLHLNEATEVRLTSGRQLALASGEVFAEVAPQPGAPLAIETPAARVDVTGTRLNVKVEGEATTVDVSRGTVEVSGGGARVEVGAGERAIVRRGAAPRVSVSGDLALVTDWVREVRPPSAAAQSIQQGFGSLTARVPGQGASRALELASQQVRVVVQDNVARTEVEQQYHNSSSQTLEGTYRFPLPPGASISRLALYVGDRLEEGEIVERQRARAIFRQIVEDTIRPRDPALLEWVGGRIFQMKIFPIPPRSSRRVILAYTQPLHASYGRYQYVYPMSVSSGAATRVGRFAVSMKIAHGRGLGPISTPLYPVLTERRGDAAAELRYEATDFVPAASFVVNFAPQGEPPELQLALYESPAARGGRCAVAAPPASAVTRQQTPASGWPIAEPLRLQPCGDQGGFFMAVVRPELPSGRQARQRDYLFLLDSSHATGRRGWDVQRSVLEAFLAEMDLRARFNVLACDARCKALGSEFRPANAEARKGALAFVAQIAPGGASDLQGAFAEAAALASRGKDVHVVYVGDGRPTAGELREPELARIVVDALRPARASLSALQVGEDVGELFLAEATRRLGGALHALEAGDDIAARAFEIVAAQYRPTLTDLELEVEGADVHSVYPQRLPTLSAGSEVVLVGRYGRAGAGALRLRGQLDGRPFERRFPIELAARADERQANAFIPRLWAQHHLDALSVADYQRNRPEIVRVSRAYTVLSRATAFLVLENERMYREFRVARTRQRNEWQGEKIAVRDGRDQPQTTAATPAAQSKDEAKSAAGQAPAAGASEAAPGLGTKGKGRGAFSAPAEDDRIAAAEPVAAAARTQEDPDADGQEVAGGERERSADKKAGPPKLDAAPPSPPARRARISRPLAKSAKPVPSDPYDALGDGSYGGGGGYYYRRRTLRWVSRAAIEPLLDAAPSRAGLLEEQRLRQLVEQRPLLRQQRRAYHRALVRNGHYAEALRHAAQWVELEAERPDALRALGDAQAALVGIEPAMRSYSAMVEVQPWNARLHEALAEMYRHKGELRRACAHRWSMVSLAPQQLERQLALARCLAGAGERDAALRVLATAGAATRGGRAAAAAIARALATLPAGPSALDVPRMQPTLEVSATWSTPVDLDVVLVTPRGERISALQGTAQGRALVDSRDGREAERVGLRWAGSGAYRVELVLAAAGAPPATISGTMLIKGFGRSQVVPFVLGDRGRAVARVNVSRHLAAY